MKKAFEITDVKIISEILANAQFGTLALCVENKPYSVPINFVESDGDIFFHGAKKGKKIEIMKQNTNVSFSVVEDYSLLPSYFSSDKGDACPATHMFKSIIIDGTIEFIEEYEEKVKAMGALMQKLQKEGKYIPLNHEMYKKVPYANLKFSHRKSSMSGNVSPKKSKRESLVTQKSLKGSQS